MDDEESGGFYEEFRIKNGNSYNCILCGEPAEYMRYGYTWCEEHKKYLDDNPEELEEMIIKKYEVTEPNTD
ncbi:MAG: hypothetical protein KAT28_00795 [Candidatus Aenigmarchaeota archaeon]|nr:hypothetical protein [Candidatus Aenigmarchaeota archaeon]